MIKNCFPPEKSGMSKMSKIMKKHFGLKMSRDVTFQGQDHEISSSLLLILVAYVRMHLCAKFDANRIIHLRVIQMALRVTDRQTESQSNSYTQVITKHKIFFQKSFAVKIS